MKNSLSLITLMLTTTLSLSAFAGTSNLIKTEREDFNALIQEGLDSQKELRKELRLKAGMPESERSWNSEINDQGRRLMGVVEAEQRVSPTTNFVRKSPVRPTAQDLNQERIAEEYDSLDH